MQQDGINFPRKFNSEFTPEKLAKPKKESVPTINFCRDYVKLLGHTRLG